MSRQNSQIVYKLLTNDELQLFQKTGEFCGTPLDLKDGYIHMSSNSNQYERVLKKYYVGVSPVNLVHIKTNQLEHLKYEKISNGDIYPHQYGKLQFVRDVHQIEIIQ